MTISANISQLPTFVFSNGVRYRTDGQRPMKDVASNSYDWSVPKPPAASTATGSSSGGSVADGDYKLFVVGESRLGWKGAPFSDDAVSVTVSGGSGSGSISVSFPTFYDPQVVSVCVYRTRVNEASPFYYAGAASNGSSPLTLTGGDDDLDLANFLQPPTANASDENALAGPFRYAAAPAKTECEMWDGRAWMACEKSYTTGRFSATHSSATWTGDANVVLTAAMVGKRIRFTDEDACYTIAEILDTGRLRTDAPYTRPGTKTSDPSNSVYEIIGDENEVRYSEPNEPEYWPTVNTLKVGDDDGSQLKAIKCYLDSLLCFTQTKIAVIHRTGDSSMPYGVRQTMSHVGSVSPRSIVKAASGVYFWGCDGFYRYDNQQSTLVSEALGDLVERIKDTAYIRGILHRERIYWAVSIDTEYLDHVLVYDPSTQIWDVWDGFRIIDIQDVVHEDGRHFIYLEEPCGHGFATFVIRDDALNDGLWMYDYSGSPTVASTKSLICLSSSFPTSGLGLKGRLLRIISGTGVGQTGRILLNTKTVITLEDYLKTAPDSTSVFTIGQIRHYLESGEVDFGAPQELKTVKHVEFTF